VTVLSIPDPCLLLLVGAAGSGKSTLATRLFAPDEVLSSDAYRERISGDAADQRATRRAFEALHRDVDARLAAGLSVVVDATNVQRHARSPLLRRAATAGVPVVAVVLDLPEAIVLGRNASRERMVPEEAVRRQLATLRAALRPGGLDAEGYERLIVLRTPDAVALLAVTRPTRLPGPPRPDAPRPE
jgi:predicted kinase